MRAGRNLALWVLPPVAIFAAAALTLHLMGRAWWCEAGDPSPWSWDIWSRHNSQHLLDPYAFTHVTHGLAFYLLAAVVFRWTGRLGNDAARFSFALALEAGWEVLENTPLVIDRYREVTLAIGYYGDSIPNSLFDIVACAAGFALATRLSARGSVALFVALELGMALWIRDGMLLSALMLIWPVEAIRTWQTP